MDFPALLLLILIFSSNLSASLGQPVVSIEKDRQALRTDAAIVTKRESFAVHSLRTDGHEVREYVLPNGTVFAVSWRGVARPDLTVLLGDYYRDYRSAEKTGLKKRGRRANSSQSHDLVLEKSGHMRDVRGKAYIASLMPDGVKPEDIN